MLAARAVASPAVAPLLDLGLRAIATSANSAAGVLLHAIRRSDMQAPPSAVYIYPSPGTSFSEPRYFGDEKRPTDHLVGTMEPPVHRVSPTKKSAMLHLLITSPRLKLRRGPVGGARVAQ